MSRVPSTRPVRQREPRVPDKKRLAYIRTLPCLVCNAPPPSEAAHLRIGHVGGTGIKPPDDLVVPLCRRDHGLETKGPPIFWRNRMWCDPTLVARAMHALARSLRTP